MLSNSRDVVPCHVIAATDGGRPGQEEEIGSVRGEVRGGTEAVDYCSSATHKIGD